ncbi:MAG: diaminopimelate decarboxylase [Myxococcales bacterium]|nr:diaminopimelate decarboxylase [Myxococcales bacterium]
MELTKNDQGVLCCEGIPLNDIADDVGTPAYVYSGQAIDQAFDAVRKALSFGPHLIAYAVKANSTLAVLRRLRDLGAGADIVSGGELLRCRKAGIPANRIVFSGVGKRDEEIQLALDEGVRSIHVESQAELRSIEQIAAASGKRATISIRLNPNVDAKTHPYIATGLHNTKFGVEAEEARRLLPSILDSEHLELEGLACHIGSQLSDPKALEEAITIVAKLAVEFREQGAPIRSIDAGGGWPIVYGNEGESLPQAADLGLAIKNGLLAGGLSPTEIETIVEPGRSIVGKAGLLLTRVIFQKDQPKKRFVIVDAAMNDLIRPALYQAYHDIRPVKERESAGAPIVVDVVGPVCESGDFFARDRPLAPVEKGDLLAVLDAGAYSMVMTSNYNTRPRPPEVLVEGTSYRVVRKRETIQELWRGETP